MNYDNQVSKLKTVERKVEGVYQTILTHDILNPLKPVLLIGLNDIELYRLECKKDTLHLASEWYDELFNKEKDLYNFLKI